MDDLRARFRAVDGVRAPDLWDEIEEREPRFPSAGRRRSGVPIALGTVVVIAGLLGAALVTNRDEARLDVGDAPAKTNGKIAFVRADPASAIREGATIETGVYVIDPDGTKLLQLSAETTHRAAPAWSPDGQTLAFLRRGIIAMTADGSSDRRVFDCEPPECSGIGSPAWSRDGKNLAFWSDWKSRSVLWVITPTLEGPSSGSAGKFRPLDISFVGSLSWSPNRDEFAVTESDGSISIVEYPSLDIDRRISAPDFEFGESPSWAPNGRHIAAAAAEGGVYLMNADGRALKRITNGDDHYPAWSPDGKLIVFTRGVNEPGSDGFEGDLYVIEVESGRERALTTGPGLDCCASWQPLPRD